MKKIYLITIYFLLAFGIGNLYAQKWDAVIKQGVNTVVQTKAVSGINKIEDLLEEKNITTSINDALPVAFWLKDLDEFHQPKIATTSDYKFVLNPGYYQYKLQSYCLKAGTHGPTTGAGYLLAPIKGKRSDLVKNILKRSAEHPDIKQTDIQRLLWGIIAGTKFTDFDAAFQNRVRPLMSGWETADLSYDLKSVIAKKTLDAMPEDVKKTVKFYQDFRSKITNPKVAYNELVSMAMLDGVLPEDPLNEHIQKGLWTYIGNGFYAKALPNGYTETVYCVYKPQKVNATYDAKNRLTKLNKNCYSIEIIYDDAPGRDVISFGTGNVYPIWRISSIQVKDLKSNQEYTIKNTGWIVRNESNAVGKSKVSSRSGDPTFQEYNDRVSKITAIQNDLDNYLKKQAKKTLNNAQKQQLSDTYAQFDGLIQASKQSNTKTMSAATALYADYRNTVISSLVNEEVAANTPLKADIITNLANPATNGNQRLAMSERPSRPVQRPSMPVDENCVDNFDGNTGNIEDTTQESVVVDDYMLARFADFAYTEPYQIRGGERGYGKLHITGFTDWEIVKREKISSDKFSCYLFKNGNNYVFAIRGTRPPSMNTIKDWEQTLNYVLANPYDNPEHAQIESLNKYLKELVYPLLADRRNHIYITGHSLGGLLALESYRMIYEDNKEVFALLDICTFNALGVISETANTINQYLTDLQKIRNYYACCDIARWACTKRFEYPGKSIPIDIYEKDKHEHVTGYGTGAEETYIMFQYRLLNSPVPLFDSDIQCRLNAHALTGLSEFIK